MSQFYKASVEIEYEDTFDTDDSPWEVADDILRDLKSDIEEIPGTEVKKIKVVPID